MTAFQFVFILHSFGLIITGCVLFFVVYQIHRLYGRVSDLESRERYKAHTDADRGRF
jgi:hypothetical protein